MHNTCTGLRRLAIVLTVLATGCQSSSAAPPAVTAPEASPTAVPVTEPSPSATLTPHAEPTSTPTEPAEPTATYAPEIVATKPEDIAGVWFINWVNLGSTVRFNAALTFSPDSTFSMDDRDAGMHIFAGTLQFADGKVTLDSDECYDEVKGVFYHCAMRFTIYARLQDGKPVLIRFVSDGGKGTFHKNVDNRTLHLYPP